MLQQTRPGRDWDTIKSVLLDMDGTLLDLHFDNYFWREFVPRRYAEHHAMSLVAAQAELGPRFRRMEGTLQWYCLDHWTEELGLDIAALKREIAGRIRVLPEVEATLARLHAIGKRLVLVTNAHSTALAIKLEQTGLGTCFDCIVSSHRFGTPKETAGFWTALQAIEPFDPEATLFADDSLPVLRAARDYGIRHLIAMRQPDSTQPAREITEFPSVQTLAELIP